MSETLVSSEPTVLPNGTSRLYDAYAAAKYLGVSAYTIHRWRKSGRLPQQRGIGRAYVFTEEELDDAWRGLGYDRVDINARKR